MTVRIFVFCYCCLFLSFFICFVSSFFFFFFFFVVVVVVVIFCYVSFIDSEVKLLVRHTLCLFPTA